MAIPASQVVAAPRQSRDYNGDTVPTGLTDTDADSLRVHIELLRRATPGRRAAIAIGLSADVISISLAGIRRRNPGLSSTDAGITFVGIHYGPELAEAVRVRLKPGARR